MNLQEKMLETTAQLRKRAAALTTAALTSARTRSAGASKRVDLLKGSFATLGVAGRELNKVARRHAARFLKENSSIAASAGKDVSELARNTFATLSQKPARKTRKSPVARKRAARKAA